MINEPLVKKLLANIVEKDYEENLKKRFKDQYPAERVPEGGINVLINTLQLPQEDVNYIVEDIQKTVEETIIPIIKALIDSVETDEEIAKKTGIKLNIVRKMLYKLYDLGIANYKRSKDPETQWFTYSWKFEKEELVARIKKDSERELDKLKSLLEHEENNMFFVCPQGHMRVDFNEASDYEFLCDICLEDLEFQDNSDIIKNLKKDIKEAESNLKSFMKAVDK